MIKKIISTILLVSFVFVFLACSNTGENNSYVPAPSGGDGGVFVDGGCRAGEAIGGGAGYAGKVKESATGSEIKTGEETNEEQEENKVEIEAGQLTAKALFDNDDYNYFYSLTKSGQTKEENGAFYDFNNEFKFVKNRIKVTILNGPLAKVDLLDDNDEVICTRCADKNGVCYLFGDKKDSYKIRVSVKNSEGNDDYEIFENVKNEDTIELTNETTFNEKIEIALVIDATGSMMDEIDYLKEELKDVISRISETSSNPISLALIFYRDEEDEYVTRVKDFSTNIDEQINFLSQQTADGGGDFEEAIQEAYDKATKLQWTTGKSTKILIHVADAPCHDADATKCANYIDQLAEKGVRIITVASSGIDKKTEYFFRCQSVQTNGCYAFLTDDSGISVGDHLEATINKDLTTEYLNDLLVRVVNGMHTGHYEEPVSIKTNEEQNQNNQQEPQTDEIDNGAEA